MKISDQYKAAQKDAMECHNPSIYYTCEGFIGAPPPELAGREAGRHYVGPADMPWQTAVRNVMRAARHDEKVRGMLSNGMLAAFERYNAACDKMQAADMASEI